MDSNAAEVSNTIPRVLGWIDPANMGSHTRERCQENEYAEVLGHTRSLARCRSVPHWLSNKSRISVALLNTVSQETL